MNRDDSDLNTRDVLIARIAGTINALTGLDDLHLWQDYRAYFDRRTEGQLESILEDLELRYALMQRIDKGTGEILGYHAD